MKGSWSVAVTARAPEYQVNEFLEHYIGLGCDNIYIFFDDEEYSSYNSDNFSGKVIAFTCNDRYWKQVYKAPPNSHRVGRPDAVEVRQGINALYARSIMTSEWLLHVDIDELIFAKKNVNEVLSEMPEYVFSVLLRTLEAVYTSVKGKGQETDTRYFKKSTHDKNILKQIYSDEALTCASNGFFGTLIGKSFIRKEPKIKSMSVHWPTPMDTYYTTNVPTYFIDLMHFEAQSFDLFKEKHRLRAEKDVAKHMPMTNRNRLEISKREFSKYGENGLLKVYKDLYVLDGERLKKAIDLGVVVEIDWEIGRVFSDNQRLLNNPIFDRNAKVSNFGGTLLKTRHNSYMCFDKKKKEVVCRSPHGLCSDGNLVPIEIEINSENYARIFFKENNLIFNLVAKDNEILCIEDESTFTYKAIQNGDYINLKSTSGFLSASPKGEVCANRDKASHWEMFQTKEVYPQIS